MPLCDERDVQSHYAAWQSAVEEETKKIEDNKLGMEATLLAKTHENSLREAECHTKGSALLKIKMALHYVRLNTAPGDDANWDMIESAARDLSDPPATLFLVPVLLESVDA